MMEKTCSKCGITKPETEFYLTTKHGKPYRNPRCICCMKEYNDSRKAEKSAWYQANKESLKAKHKDWKTLNRDEYLERKKADNAKRKDAHRKYLVSWNAENKDKIHAAQSRYYKNNKEKIKSKNVKYHMARLRSDPVYKLKYRCYDAMRYALRNGETKSDRTLNLIGCSALFLKNHLESMFQDGMTWDNYGEWHIDHKYPCSRFDLSKPDEQKRCFNWSNLQPMWGIENKRKQDRVVCDKPELILEFVRAAI